MNLRTRILSIAVVVVGAACSLAEDGPSDRAPAETTPPPPASTVSSSGESAGGLVDPRRAGLELGFGEFAITLEATEIRPGPVTFVIRNGGRLVHGFEIEIEERGDNSGPGNSHEDGLKMEGPAFGPGETVRLSADLAPGVYEIECFVAEHDDMGMRATLVVRRGAPLVKVEQPNTGSGRVEIADFAFSPDAIEVDAGTTVTWRNADPTTHTVSAKDGAFDSGMLDPGAGFETTFEEPGTFAYFCQIHPTMRGAVRVLAG